MTIDINIYGNEFREVLKELNGEIFRISCESEIGTGRYCFDYKIIDIENRKVEFIKKQYFKILRIF